MKLFPLLLATVAFTGVSCERHEFEGPDGTKQLHEHHANHAEGADHGGHGKNPEHGEPPAH